MTDVSCDGRSLSKGTSVEEFQEFQEDIFVGRLWGVGALAGSSQWMVQWVITMVIIRPQGSGCGVSIPNGLFTGLYKWGVILTTYDTWDDPPSIPRKLDKHIKTWQWMHGYGEPHLERLRPFFGIVTSMIFPSAWRLDPLFSWFLRQARIPESSKRNHHLFYMVVDLQA